jgi:hypothetical protein
MSESRPTPSLSSLSRNDQIFLGAGVLTFIFSFIDFAHVKVTGFAGSAGSISAWHGIGTLAGLLILIAIVVAALTAFAPSALEQLPVSGRLIAVGGAALGFVFFIIRWLTLPSQSFGGFHAGFHLAWGGYVTLILNIAMIAVGFLALKETGESMPWENRGTATPPPPAAPPAPPTA